MILPLLLMMVFWWAVLLYSQPAPTQLGYILGGLTGLGVILLEYTLIFAVLSLVIWLFTDPLPLLAPTLTVVIVVYGYAIYPLKVLLPLTMGKTSDNIETE